ncbi:Mpo1-like protein [uncultured Shewanella sp.]|uniref:Mpo1 family 2-hydroxy fatty acid dioxygenase n=1 Tax=uncultured Shewanella sp. TaxID=173975 RepID=UPI002623328A|nr:Mpo1-like protein [uncultured Shewanella sp.]
MRNAVERLSTYKSVHLNRNNVKTHFIGVPLIVLSVFILLALTPVAILFGDYRLPIDKLAVIVLSIYYLMLNIRLALGLILVMLITLLIANIIADWTGAIWLAIGLFVIGWVIQFLGHYFEKAKPAFIDDLDQLLIGPFFLMAEGYFHFGWLSSLEEEITAIAMEKRQKMNSKK